MLMKGKGLSKYLSHINKFLVDVLAEEISRVDKRTYDLFEEL